MATTTVGKIGVEITSDNSGLLAGIKDANKSVEDFGRNFKRDFAVAAASVTALAAGVVAFGASALRAYSQQEDAINELNVALRNQGVLLPGVSEDLQRYASELQRTSTFGDEVITSTQALLVSYGITGQTLKDVTRATLDLATAKKIDLRTAADLVGKAFAGETGTLSRYGIIVDSSLSRSEKFAAVMEQLNSRFGGASQAAIETTSGKIEVMKNRVGDLQERIGEELLPVFNAWLGAAEKLIGIAERFAGAQANDAKGIDLTIMALERQRKELLEHARLRGNVLPNGLVVLNNAERERLKLIDDAIIRERQKKETEAEATAAAIANAQARTAAEFEELERRKQQDAAYKEAQKQAEIEGDAFTAAMQGAAKQREDNLRLQRVTAERETANLLTTIGTASQSLMDTVFSNSLTAREKKQRAFQTAMKLIQDQVTKLFIASQAEQSAAAVKTSAVEVAAAKPAIAANFFKAHSFLPFVGQAIALGFIAASFAFIDRLVKFNKGGIVPGTGNSDTVPALLTPGEMVIPKRQTAAILNGGGGGGGGPSKVELNIYNPVVDSRERLDELADQVGEILMDRVFINARVG